MIQVQIASTLEAGGVAGVRWVLIDPSDTATTPATPQVQPAQAAAGQPSLAGARVKRTPLTLHVISAVLLLGALAGAWWAASLLLDARGSAAPQTSTAKAPARPS